MSGREHGKHIHRSKRIWLSVALAIWFAPITGATAVMLSDDDDAVIDGSTGYVLTQDGNIGTTKTIDRLRIADDPNDDGTDSIAAGVVPSDSGATLADQLSLIGASSLLSHPGSAHLRLAAIVDTAVFGPDDRSASSGDYIGYHIDLTLRYAVYNLDHSLPELALREGTASPADPNPVFINAGPTFYPQPGGYYLQSGYSPPPLSLGLPGQTDRRSQASGTSDPQMSGLQAWVAKLIATVSSPAFLSLALLSFVVLSLIKSFLERTYRGPRHPKRT